MTSDAPIIPIYIQRNGVEKKVEVEPVVEPRQGWGRKNLRQIELLPAQTPLIARVAPKSPAAEVGLRSGDLVVAANNTKLLSPVALAEILKKETGHAVQLTIRRHLDHDSSTTFIVTITPRLPVGGSEPRLGIYWDERGVVSLSYPNPFSQIMASVATMWETISAVAKPHSKISVQHLSGPVGIMRVYYMLFECPMGWRLALWFSVVLNVNLALLNLLPLPVLDGGHILLACCELILRRPIQHRLLEWIQSSCACILIGFMVYVTFFDLLDLPWLRAGKETSKAAAMQFEGNSR